MAKFQVPGRGDVSASNQAIFDTLQKNLGFVPNLFAYIGKNDTALADYLALSGRKTTLTAKEKEVISLTVSQINGCRYCQSAHTALGKMNGFTEEQILDIRTGSVPFDSKLNALAQLAASITTNKGRVADETIEAFFKAGYNEQNLIDLVLVISDKIITNYLLTFRPN